MINVFDSVMLSVEEYNDYARKKDLSKCSYEELRGLFYNYLRRNIGYISRGRFPIAVNKIVCKFTSEGLIHAYRIENPSFFTFVDNDIVNEIIRIGSDYPVIYPTKILNEMAHIINSIKS